MTHLFILFGPLPFMGPNSHLHVWEGRHDPLHLTLRTKTAKI